MDHGGESERESPAESQCQSDIMCDNTPGPAPLGSPAALHWMETRLPPQELAPEPGEDGGALPPGSGDNEDEGVHEPTTKEEEEESEVSYGSIRCRSPGTPTTDSSFSETGSLLDTPFSPGTSPEPPSPLNPEGAVPGSPHPLRAPAEPSQWGLDADSRRSKAVPGDTGEGGEAWLNDTTGPVGSSGLTRRAPALGPASASSSARTAGAQMNALNSSTGSTPSEPVDSPGPTCSNASITGSDAERLAPGTGRSASTEARDEDLPTSDVGEIRTATETHDITPSPCTEPSETATQSSAAVRTVSPCATGPSTSAPGLSISAPGPSTCAPGPSTCAPGPTSVSAPSSARGPIPRPALLSCLEQLEHRGDDTHLPQYLHQIAEAFVIQEDYQRAIWCIQLEKLYHQRLLDNLSSLQKQWESSCRSLSPSDLGPRLDALTHICQTHNRPAAHAVCASLELLKASTMTHDEKPLGELTFCTSGHLTKAEVGERQRDSDSRLSGKRQTTGSSTGSDHLDGEQPTAGEESARSSDAQEGGAVHTGQPITAGAGIPPSTVGVMDRSEAAERQGVEGEATQEKEDRADEQEEEEEERATSESREDAHAMEMEDKRGGGGGGGGEEELARLEGEGGEGVPEETDLSGIEEVVPLLQQEAVAADNQWEVTQLCLHSQQQEANGGEEEHAEVQDYGPGIIEEAYHLDDQAKLITIEEVTPASGLVSILKKRSVLVSACPAPVKAPAKRRVRFKVADDGYDQEVGGGDSCLLLFLLCLVTVVISIGGTALYCAMGDAHSTVCKDFSRNADFYVGQMQRGISQLQHWLVPGS